MIRTRFLLIAAAVVLPPATTYADAPDTPAPIKALKQRGFEIKGTFKAPNGLKGYAASHDGKPVAVYLTPNGKQAIFGTMVDGKGNNLSTAPLQRLVANPRYQKAWPKLENATWVPDGSNHDKRVIYMFTDANCPYCHQFWQEARPWVNADKVQIRHVLVALLKPSSLPKAAAILASDHPSAALDRLEQNYGSGGIQAMSHPTAGLIRKIGRNTDFMQSLGLYTTPTIFYRNDAGHVAVMQGVPQGKALTVVMGSPKP